MQRSWVSDPSTFPSLSGGRGSAGRLANCHLTVCEQSWFFHPFARCSSFAWHDSTVRITTASSRKSSPNRELTFVRELRKHDLPIRLCAATRLILVAFVLRCSSSFQLLLLPNFTFCGKFTFQGTQNFFREAHFKGLSLSSTDADLRALSWTDHGHLPFCP